MSCVPFLYPSEIIVITAQVCGNLNIDQILFVIVDLSPPMVGLKRLDLYSKLLLNVVGLIVGR